MKNPTILKDELSLLRADKSAVIIELRNKGVELHKICEDISTSEKRREEVRTETQEETARLEDIRGRAVSVKAELVVASQDLKNTQNSLDISKQKQTQEIKNHLGRIKELEEEDKDVLLEISRLKNLFDNNSRVFNSHESDRQSKLRAIDLEITIKTKELKEITITLSKGEEEEKKLTKDRLKREDRLRARERSNEGKEFALGKREEDLITMSKDMMIVYGRLKEIYSKTNPDVDLDKLILQAV